MTDIVSEDGQLDPAAVLAAAIDRLRADGHADLAEAVERVDAYVRDLAVAHTEIALVGDRLIERGQAVLGRADSNTSSSPGQPPR